MAVRRLAWVMGLTLAACGTGEVIAPTIQPTQGTALTRVADPAAAPTSADAPLRDPAVLSLADLPHDDRGVPLPADADQLAGPVLPPEVVSVMTYDTFRLTLDAHGPGIGVSGSGSAVAADLVLGSTSVVDDPAPPAAIEIE